MEKCWERVRARLVRVKRDLGGEAAVTVTEARRLFLLAFAAVFNKRKGVCYPGSCVVTLRRSAAAAKVKSKAAAAEVAEAVANAPVDRGTVKIKSHGYQKLK